MKPNIKRVLSLSCIPVALVGISQGASLLPMTTVRIETVGSTGQAGSLTSLQISTGSVRADVTAPPSNGPSEGTMNSQGSTPQPSGTTGENTSSGHSSDTAAQGSSSGHRTATNEAASNGAIGAAGAPATRSTRNGKTVPVAGSAATSAKGVIPPPEITYANPGAFHLNVDAGYANKHIWRGIDLPQFTSFNYLDKKDLPKANSDVTFIGANVTYEGFMLGVKYIETIDNNFNPFFARYLDTLDSYSELVISANYTRMLVGSNWLQGTVGLDFYYYPNDEFWGVSNQGMAYLRFSSPHYKWAQPFVELFYNFAIDSTGSGLAEGTPDQTKFPGATSFRGATGSQLVEGRGFEAGVAGGDHLWANDSMSFGLTYSVSTIYKSGYAFENDGFSQLIMTIGAPIAFGSHITLTPSVSYVEGLSHISPQQHAVVAGGGSAAEVWNSPGWVAVLKASWQF